MPKQLPLSGRIAASDIGFGMDRPLAARVGLDEWSIRELAGRTTGQTVSETVSRTTNLSTSWMSGGVTRTSSFNYTTSWNTQVKAPGTPTPTRIAYSDLYGKAAFRMFPDVKTLRGPYFMGQDYGLAGYVTYNARRIIAGQAVSRVTSHQATATLSRTTSWTVSRTTSKTTDVTVYYPGTRTTSWITSKTTSATTTKVTYWRTGKWTYVDKDTGQQGNGYLTYTRWTASAAYSATTSWVTNVTTSAATAITLSRLSSWSTDVTTSWSVSRSTAYETSWMTTKTTSWITYPTTTVQTIASVTTSWIATVAASRTTLRNTAVAVSRSTSKTTSWTTTFTTTTATVTDYSTVGSLNVTLPPNAASVRAIQIGAGGAGSDGGHDGGDNGRAGNPGSMIDNTFSVTPGATINLNIGTGGQVGGSGGGNTTITANGTVMTASGGVGIGTGNTPGGGSGAWYSTPGGGVSTDSSYANSYYTALTGIRSGGYSYPNSGGLNGSNGSYGGAGGGGAGKRDGNGGLQATLGKGGKGGNGFIRLYVYTLANRTTSVTTSYMTSWTSYRNTSFITNWNTTKTTAVTTSWLTTKTTQIIKAMLEYNATYSGSWTIENSPLYGDISIGINTEGQACETATHVITALRGCANGYSQTKTVTYRLNALRGGMYEALKIGYTYTQAAC